MDEFVDYIVKNLVDNPSEVNVSCETKESEIVLGIRVAEKDVGKVIGRQGKTIHALRTIVGTAAARLGTRARVEVLSDTPSAE